MLILYNILQITVLLLFFPLICCYIAAKEKYRRHIPKRLGMTLNRKFSRLHPRRKTIWIHALSVGEVTSALPLVAELRKELDDTTIIFSASTQSGYALAKKVVGPYSDLVIAFPLDLSPVCRYYIELLKPNLFVLVETDFWPNFLEQLEQYSIPALLINGRISQKSLRLYKRYLMFFKPMFDIFRFLSMQTESDRQKCMELGIPAEKILKLGNLKYEPAPAETGEIAALFCKKTEDTLLVAGSTHPGEEEILLNVFTKLRQTHSLKMILAPRNVQRADAVAALAESRGLTIQLRSGSCALTEDLLILDSLGELVSFYQISDICFVGGSLVKAGGHNPLEPACQEKPVIFGKHMDDFEEISEELIAAGGAFMVSNEAELAEAVDTLINDTVFRYQCGKAALAYVLKNRNVVANHIQLIRESM
ncbi:MAG: 3-deoxy-D-manno-octulosonic acid transferase [Desulfopila sp.]|jgi:3-deoxy-D-manno-octulosonic-acid transferase|nr:3-deoxy-D-manno-octulosonic acid transferase [Desulfopila sp.]